MKIPINVRIFLISVLLVILGIGLSPLFDPNGIAIMIMFSFMVVGFGGMIYSAFVLFIGTIKEIQKGDSKFSSRKSIPINIVFSLVFFLTVIATVKNFWNQGTFLYIFLIFVITLEFFAYKKVISWYTKDR